MFLLIYYKSLWKTAAMRGEIAQRMKIYKNIDNSKLKTRLFKSFEFGNGSRISDENLHT